MAATTATAEMEQIDLSPESEQVCQSPESEQIDPLQNQSETSCPQKLKKIFGCSS
jgi:hypothetical protein